MIDHNHFICHFIFGGHLLNIPIYHTSHVYPNLFERPAQKKSGARRWPGPDFPVGLKNTTLAYL